MRGSVKIALITGVAGQDGSYLSEYLLELGYEVHGTVRRQSVAEHQESRIDHLGARVHTHYADLLDAPSIERIIAEVKPDEIYNLGAQSHVRISFDVPVFTTQANALGVLHVIDAARRLVPGVKLYQASSSEMFGTSVDEDGFQRETTRMTPTSPYGIAKVFGFNTVRHFRNAYKMHATNGILFNHSSARRGSNFVEAKICKGAAMIYCGKQNKLELGNMDSYRDFGHSKDYVRAMHLMLQQPEPGDWVVATGETHSVREICAYVFGKLGMRYEDYVTQNSKFLRPEELPYLRGDSKRIRELGWKPTYTFETLLDDILGHWLERFGSTIGSAGSSK